jgi:hypothetical protein
MLLQPIRYTMEPPTRRGRLARFLRRLALVGSLAIGLVAATVLALYFL